MTHTTRPLQQMLFLLVLWCMSTATYAATCTFTSGAANLGTPSSFAVNTTAQSVTTSSGYACSGSALSILGTNSTSVKIGTSTNDMRLKSPADVYIPYQLCKSASCSDGIFSTNTEVTWSSTSLIGLLGLFNASGNTLPITVRTSVSNVPAGIYQDTVTLNWTYIHCSIAVGPVLCVGTLGAGSTTINITMEVKKACAMADAPDINFGTAPLPSKFTNKAAQVSVRCTNQLAYNINMTSSNPVNGNWRQMSAVVNGSTYYLQYQLLNSANALWTHLTNHTGAGTGNVQLIDYTAAVNQAQPNLPAGVYKDTVTITLTY
jgi:spore coat protein U-like protein